MKWRTTRFNLGEVIDALCVSTRRRWTLRCRDLRGIERFLTIAIDRATGQVHLTLGSGATVRLTGEDVSRLRRHLGDAQVIALQLSGWDTP